MARVAARIPDRRVLRLIRSYLTAGVINNGLFEISREGTPQGGPLSPLLSNLVLDELDRELERRGHCFVRYADDCNIYVRSEKAGHRVMANLTRFIEGRLKLQVNAQKSAVARPWQRSFLGFTVTDEPQPRRRIADKAVTRFKDRVRDLTRRNRGVSLERMIADLNPLLRGWAGYFGFSQWRELGSLDGWTRRRLRCVVWVQWKTRGRRYKELRRLNVPSATDASMVLDCFPWRRWWKLNPPNRRGTDPYARWCGRGGIARCPPIPIDGPEPGASLMAGRNDGFARAVVRTGLADRDARAVVTAQATPAMENRQRATWILVHLHRRPDKVWTQRALRYL
jgi:Reverse transcriptase (RNA-dependent DNA polymerase)/Group II intron, maturase-specific domain